jgi:tartrate-resistant acid phosphatase type 5
MWAVLMFTIVKADFAVMGDWGRSGTHAQRKVAKVLNEQNPDFVVSVGDNFYSTGIESATDIRAHSWVEIYNTSVPWYVCLGNHDYLGNAAAQVDMTRIYKQWYMPDRFFNIKIKDIELFFIDTTPWLNGNYVESHYGVGLGPWEDLEYQKTRLDEQKSWLNDALLHSSANRKFIVGHHPLWTFGLHPNASGDFAQFLKGVLLLYNVEAYLCGHDHNMQHIISKDGIHEYISGAGASGYPIEKSEDDTLRFASWERGFLMVRNNGAFEFIQSDGHILYTFK